MINDFSPPPIFALTYYSRASRAFEEEELFELAAQSSGKNKSLSITGFLSYRQDQFLQYLEGNQEAVLSLMNVIEQDERHTILRAIVLPDINHRQFQNWHMRYWRYDELVQINTDHLLEDVLTKMSQRSYGEKILLQCVPRLVYRMAELQ